MLYTADRRTGNEEIEQPIDNDKIQFYQRKKTKQINKIRVFGCRGPGYLVYYVGTIMAFLERRYYIVEKQDRNTFLPNIQRVKIEVEPGTTIQ